MIKDDPWLVHGICVDCDYRGDMEWRMDGEGNEYAVCPECDREIGYEEMPNE